MSCDVDGELDRGSDLASATKMPGPGGDAPAPAASKRRSGDFGRLLGNGQRIGPSATAGVELRPPRALHEGSACLEEIRAELRLLVDLTMQQAARTDNLQRQLAEQSRLTSSTAQSVQDLKSQVNAMHHEMIDVLRGGARTAHHRQEPPVEPPVQPSRFEDRRGARVPLGSPPQAGPAGSPSHGSSPPPQRPGLVRKQVMSATGDATAPVRASQPAFGGFTRSPPGLGRGGAARVVEPALAMSGAAADLASAPDLLAIGGDNGVDEDVRAFFAAVRSGDNEVAMPAVLTATAHVANQVDEEYSMTALHYAALQGDAEVVRALLGRGDFARTRALDRNGDTALHIAALHDRGDACDAILTFDPESAGIVNRFGETPCDVARRRGNPAVCTAFRDRAARGLSPPSPRAAAKEGWLRKAPPDEEVRADAPAQ